MIYILHCYESFLENLEGTIRLETNKFLYILGFRYWGSDGIRQMYVYVFVGYWFVSPLGDHMCTNVLV